MIFDRDIIGKRITKRQKRIILNRMNALNTREYIGIDLKLSKRYEGSFNFKYNENCILIINGSIIIKGDRLKLEMTDPHYQHMIGIKAEEDSSSSSSLSIVYPPKDDHPRFVVDGYIDTNKTTENSMTIRNKDYIPSEYDIRYIECIEDTTTGRVVYECMDKTPLYIEKVYFYNLDIFINNNGYHKLYDIVYPNDCIIFGMEDDYHRYSNPLVYTDYIQYVLLKLDANYQVDINTNEQYNLDRIELRSSTGKYSLINTSDGYTWFKNNNKYHGIQYLRVIKRGSLWNDIAYIATKQLDKIDEYMAKKRIKTSSLSDTVTIVYN